MVAELMCIRNTHSLDEKSRGLIYFTSITKLNAFAAKLGLASYHAEMVQGDPVVNNALKADVVDAWCKGKEPGHRWLCCTQAFGAGVDYPHVRVVVHVDPCAAMFYLQESGRGGRDGDPYFSYVLWQKKPFLADPELDPHVGVLPMLEFLTTRSCRRVVWYDINPHVHSCCAMNAERCDNCNKMSESQDVRILQELTYQAELEQVEPVPLATTPLSAGELLKAQAQQGEQKLLKIVKILEQIVSILTLH
ncbi:uncharacterized protein LAESUDRAFT_765201 [Laetiporus sulphureus 93-53]|uniref:DNA 3'-5' helicase n=1 Tax=Laetiporus sulphureus 93-53 TaxID=1314785 RepID=A0A165AWK5_9APHY|nr:uncharacterized protein LAESUDRAFT_765201 [Laetiporus sulphureus 93-53]KZS99793.1 hypothetical protein LAESUDRAFT_765201 [Laetiporus sulphureus 93-53]